MVIRCISPLNHCYCERKNVKIFLIKFKHQYILNSNICKFLVPNRTNTSNSHPLEVVGRDSETQLQVSRNLNKIAGKGLALDVGPVVRQCWVGGQVG